MNDMKDMNGYENLACYRLGLRADGGAFSDLSCCPSYGSSDCPITMGDELADCACTTDEKMKHLEIALKMMR